MPRSRRALNATAEQTVSPPSYLPPNHRIARVLRAVGNNLYQVEFAASPSLSSHSRGLSPAKCQEEQERTKSVTDEGLVELPSRFRNAIWLKWGSFVVVDTAALGERENKLMGEIVNVVREERVWRKMSWWPEEFQKGKTASTFQAADDEESSEEESRVGRMPPSESESESEDEVASSRQTKSAVTG